MLSGCGIDFTPHPGLIGRYIDMHPPAVEVVEGGPSGALISGPTIADVPEGAADRVVAASLRNWLSVEERHSLAVATQRAAVAPTTQAIDWQSHDGGNTVTASGSAVAVGDVYRSAGGEICRDVWQSVAKNGMPHAATITVCREPVSSGTVLWVAKAG